MARKKKVLKENRDAEGLEMRLYAQNRRLISNKVAKNEDELTC